MKHKILNVLSKLLSTKRDIKCTECIHYRSYAGEESYCVLCDELDENCGHGERKVVRTNVILIKKNSNAITERGVEQ